MWYVVKNLKIVSELCFQELFLSLPDNARLNLQTVIGDDAIRSFFVNVSEKFLDHTDWSARYFSKFIILHRRTLYAFIQSQSIKHCVCLGWIF